MLCADKTVIHQNYEIGICRAGLESNYEKNDVELNDLTSFFFYLKILEIAEILP